MDYPIGNYYHIFNRGNNRGPIFFSQEHYRFFLQQAHRYFEPAGLAIIAHCLMVNHFHLVTRLKRTADIPNLTRSFSCSYVKSINKQLLRTGRLFERRTQVREVRSGSNLLFVLAYVHANPVAANLVKAPGGWQHSDYNDWVTAPGDVGKEFVRVREEVVGSGAAYAGFVERWIAARAEGQDPFEYSPAKAAHAV